MKVNPKLNYFLKNKIRQTKDNPYILSEEGDKEKIQILIKETTTNKADRDYFLESIEQDIVFAIFPFNFLNELVGNLFYKKKSKGRIKVEETLMRLFPNFEELEKVHSLVRCVRDYHNSIESIEEGINEWGELK